MLTKKKKKKRRQIANIRNERGDITIDPMNIKRIVNEQYEQFYSHKFDNLNEMDQFLERYSLSKLTQEEKDNPNRPMSGK